MADNLTQPFSKSAMSEEEMVAINQEQRRQIAAFGLMIFLTLLSFLAIGADIIPSSFAIPFVLLLAFIQFFLQLFYFMHLKDKGHAWPNAFMTSAFVIITPMIAGLILLLGIVKY